MKVVLVNRFIITTIVDTVQSTVVWCRHYCTVDLLYSVLVQYLLRNQIDSPVGS